jgi:hypothetical protein
MKSILVLLIVALIAVKGASICDTYSVLPQFGNASVLVGAVVDGTVGAVTNTSNGIAKYFNGGVAGSTDFTAPANSAKLGALRSSLISFFGGALGCTDGTIAAFTGGDITIFHKKLNIDFFAYAKFNNLLLGVMLGAGVVPTDGIAVAGVLDTLRANCCIAADCFSICNKLVTPGISTTLAAISGVVNASVNLAVASPLLLPYFQGKIGTHGDFTGSKLPLLFDHLVQYFGGALGCSDGTIATYAGQSLKDAHLGMGITLAAFEAFNAAIMGVIATAIPVGSPDYLTVYGVLNGTKSDVCTASDCFGASSSGASSSGASSSKSASASASSSGSSSSATPSPSPTPAPSTGFGMVLVAPIFSLLSVFLF